MPIELGSGTLYIKNSDGSYEHLGEIANAEVTSSEVYDTSQYINRINDPEISFEIECEIPKKLWLLLTGVLECIIKCCPNKKVVHLTLNGKNKKIRKKNLKRAIKILERMWNDQI